MAAPDMEYIRKELRRRDARCRFMLVSQTIESLRRMRLTGMAEAFPAQNQDPGYRGLSFEERFGLLVDQESTYREDRCLKRLLKGVRLKTQTCVEDIHYGHSRGLDRSVMADSPPAQALHGLRHRPRGRVLPVPHEETGQDRPPGPG